MKSETWKQEDETDAKEWNMKTYDETQKIGMCSLTKYQRWKMMKADFNQ